MSEIFILAVVVAFLVWLIKPGARRSRQEGDELEPVDQTELEAAEREVRDLDVHQRPEDGFEGDDWGPGAAKRPRP
jgi:hypothetical protein